MTAPAGNRGPYRPHFRRDEAVPFQIQPRDIEIVRQVYAHRFLRSTHIAALVGGSEQQVRRRLQHLFHHGYLDRPREQLAYHLAAGKKPYAYALGNKGADLLYQEFGISPGRVDWTAKNRSAKQLFLDHTLATADVMVAFELACRARGDVRLIDTSEILAQAPRRTRESPSPFRWNVTLFHKGRRVDVGVIPDAVFGLHFLDRPEGRNRAYFFLEEDRGTMPIERKTLHRTSIFRKLLAYSETWRRKVHTNRFGINNFRVLTVTTSPERARHIQRAAAKATGTALPNVFLATDHGQLEGGDPFGSVWRNAAGETRRLDS